MVINSEIIWQVTLDESVHMVCVCVWFVLHVILCGVIYVGHGLQLEDKYFYLLWLQQNCHCLRSQLSNENYLFFFFFALLETTDGVRWRKRELEKLTLIQVWGPLTLLTDFSFLWGLNRSKDRHILSVSPTPNYVSFLQSLSNPKTGKC